MQGRCEGNADESFRGAESKPIPSAKNRGGILSRAMLLNVA